MHCSDLPEIAWLLHGPLLVTVRCVRSLLTNALNLLLANWALCDLLVCVVLRLNCASRLLAESSVQERRFLLKIFSQKLLFESQLLCIPSNLLFPHFFWDLVMLQEMNIAWNLGSSALIFP